MIKNERYFLKQQSSETPIGEEIILWAVGFNWDVMTERSVLNLPPIKCKTRAIAIYSADQKLEWRPWLTYGYPKIIANEKQILKFSVVPYRAEFIHFIGKRGKPLSKNIGGASEIYLVEDEKTANDLYLSLLEKSKQNVWSFFQEKMRAIQEKIDKESNKLKI